MRYCSQFSHTLSPPASLKAPEQRRKASTFRAFSPHKNHVCIPSSPFPSLQIIPRTIVHSSPLPFPPNYSLLPTHPIPSTPTNHPPGAQSCFAYNFAGCSTDALGGALGCHAPLCSPQWAATNNCYCRTDLQSVATSYLSSCVDKGCTVGDFSIDVSSAISIYDSYCQGNGFAAMGNSPAATTAAAGGPTGGGEWFDDFGVEEWWLWRRIGFGGCR